MNISFSEPSAKLAKTDVLIFLIGEDKKFPPSLVSLDQESGKAITRAITASKFAGKKKQFLNILSIPNYRHIILAGIGKLTDFNELSAQNLGGALVPQINHYGAKTATLILDLSQSLKTDLAQIAANIGFGTVLNSYRFSKYRTKQKPEDKPAFISLAIAVSKAKAANAAYSHLSALANGIFLTRNLVTEPANVIHPESLAAECKKLTRLGLQVTVLGEAEMQKLGMGSLLSVGQGSIHESQLVIMQWNGIKNAKAKNQIPAPLAFVGKGVCFDTGGISIKPAQSMGDMKYDMAGAGAIIGLMHTLASRKAKVNAVGIIGLVENMPDANAIRPGDVITSMSGQTIEVLNTDAEGRLVLADALWYAQTYFKPRLIVDLATLTGAISIALGSSRAGLFSNDDKLAQQLFDSGKASGDEVWRLPLAETYDRQINSDIADMQNVGKNRDAGSITAAQFLQRFIQKGVPWAHLDIAGVAWTKEDLDTCPKGATGYGIRLLDKLISQYYE